MGADSEVSTLFYDEVIIYANGSSNEGNSNIGLLIIIMLASATALVVLLFVSKRKEVQ